MRTTARFFSVASMILAGMAVVAGGCGGSVTNGRDMPGPDGSSCSAGQASCLEAGSDGQGVVDTGTVNMGGDGGADSQAFVCPTQCIDGSDLGCPIGTYGVPQGCEGHAPGNDGSFFVCCLPVDDAGPEAGSPDAPNEAATQCPLDPKGSFVFQVHNKGTRMLSLAFGCGGSLPIVLQTANGRLPIGPGPEDTCEFTCDAVYACKAGQACSDCGNGYGAALGPGTTADIQWDRRTYVETRTNPQCVIQCNGSSPTCALGTSLPSSASQAGVLTFCTAPGFGQGFCSTSEMVNFAIDTTQPEATIEVQ
jgi:hypothetical protein